MIDDQSEPGAWAAILPYCQNITVIPDPCLSPLDRPGGSHAHPAEAYGYVPSADGYPVTIEAVRKGGPGTFHCSEVDHA